MAQLKVRIDAEDGTLTSQQLSRMGVDRVDPLTFIRADATGFMRTLTKRALEIKYLTRNDFVAATDGASTVYMDGQLAQDESLTLSDRADIIKGVLLDEMGHVLWTKMSREEVISYYRRHRDFSKPYIPSLMAAMSNLTEDHYIVRRLIKDFPGFRKLHFRAVEHYMDVEQTLGTYKAECSANGRPSVNAAMTALIVMVKGSIRIKGADALNALADEFDRVFKLHTQEKRTDLAIELTESFIETFMTDASQLAPEPEQEQEQGQDESDQDSEPESTPESNEQDSEQDGEQDGESQGGEDEADGQNDEPEPAPNSIETDEADGDGESQSADASDSDDADETDADEADGDAGESDEDWDADEDGEPMGEPDAEADEDEGWDADGEGSDSEPEAEAEAEPELEPEFDDEPVSYDGATTEDTVSDGSDSETDAGGEPESDRQSDEGGEGGRAAEPVNSYDLEREAQQLDDLAMNGGIGKMARMDSDPTDKPQTDEAEEVAFETIYGSKMRVVRNPNKGTGKGGRMSDHDQAMARVIGTKLRARGTDAGGWEHGFRQGTILPRDTVKVALKSRTPASRFQARSVPNVQVAIVQDASGSIGDIGHEALCRLSQIVAVGAERVKGIETWVAMFHGFYSWNTNGEVIIVKEPGRKQKVLPRQAMSHGGGTPTAESLVTVSRMMEDHDPTSHKIIVLLTDGQPASVRDGFGRSISGNEAITKWAQENRGVEVIQVLINSYRGANIARTIQIDGLNETTMTQIVAMINDAIKKARRAKVK